MGYISFLLPREVSAEDAAKMQQAAAASAMTAPTSGYDFAPEDDYSTMQWGNATGDGSGISGWKPWQKVALGVGIVAALYVGYRVWKGKKALPKVTVK